jgi:hypothetical protein
VPTSISPTPLERAIGRSLAITLHPVAAWCSRSRRNRLVLLAGYFLASYFAVLSILHIVGL